MGLLHQATPDIILKHPDYPLYLIIGFSVAIGDRVVDDAQPFAKLCKAAHKLGAVVYLNVARVSPMGNQIIVKEYSGPPAV